MKKPVISERQLWKKLRNETTRISWTRLENWALFGTPDLLGYAPSGSFFTLELKKIKSDNSKFVRFSPHQISFHIKHPRNSYILVACSPEQGLVRLYPGSGILELVDLGLKLEPLACGLASCARVLESL
jgi:hypothetical protein